MSSKRFPVGAATAAALLLALAGCGGDGSSDPVANTSTGQAGSDTFLTEVLRIVASSADNTEPASIDAITVTSPDNTEPQPVS